MHFIEICVSLQFSWQGKESRGRSEQAEGELYYFQQFPVLPVSFNLCTGAKPGL